MDLLLDTHIILWAAGQPEKLPSRSRKLLSDPDNRLFFSPASIWEIVIKRQLGRNDFKVDPQRLHKLLLNNDYHELAITSDHVLMVASLPPIHQDPFDRILLAQARSESLLLLTLDANIRHYLDAVLDGS